MNTDLASELTRGRELAAAGRADEARDIFIAARQRFPRLVLPTVEMLHLASQGNDRKAYRALLEDAVARHPEAAFLRVNLAHFWLAEGDQAQAAKAAMALADAPVSRPQPLLQAPSLLGEIGLKDESARLWRRAVELFPVAPEVQWYLVEQEQSRLSPLAAYARKRGIALAHPGNADIQLRLAEAATLLGIFGEAEAALSRVEPDSGPLAARKSIRAGDMRHRQWRLGEAIHHYRAALKSSGHARAASEQLVRLNLITGDIDGAERVLQDLFSRSRMTRAQKGLTQRAMHSFLGSILQEFRLREADVRRIGTAKAQSATAVLDALGAMAGSRPLSLAAAMTGVVALQELGAFAPAIPDAGGSIPRRLVQYWHTASPPADVGAMMDGWRDLSGAFSYERLDDAAARVFLKANFPAEVYQAYRMSDQHERRSDILRLAYLYRHGGWYVDADSWCQAPMPQDLPGGANLCLCLEPMGVLANDIIAASPRHPLIAAALDGAVAAVQSPAWENTWLATGPGLLTRAAATFWRSDEGRADLARTVIVQRHHLAPFMTPNLRLSYKSRNTYWLRSELEAAHHPA